MYLDPGFGSMLIQFVVAAIAAGGAYFVIFRKKIMEMFSKKKAVPSESTSDQED